MTPTPNQSQVFQALGTFLKDVLPADWKISVAQQNRIPEPKRKDFVIMSPLRRERLETNVDDDEDALFTGAIAGTLMTITSVDPNFLGQIGIGSIIFGVDVADRTTVIAFGTGTGGAGTYTVKPSQNVSSRALAAGAKSVVQPTKFVVQLDFHSDDQTAGDAAGVVTAMMRDEYAVEQFASQIPDFGVSPLYAEDARQMPFINSEQQYEWRWVVEVALQADVLVRAPQQYAGALEVDLVNVDAEFPAA